MRPAAQLKCGFYPAPADAVQYTAQYLAPPEDGKRFAILDPCAGQGEALDLLAAALDCEVRDVYAVELDNGRADSLHGRFDERGAHAVAPASYFGVSAPAGTFSLIWCNPPFDDEYGGGSRVEREFLETATRHLRARGIIALVCPRSTAQKWDVRHILKSWYDEVSVIPFPDHCRKYNEVVVLGIKRAKLEAEWQRRDSDVFLDQPIVYQIPPGHGPGNRFLKIQMTDDELERAFEQSPLNAYLRPPVEQELASPPLELGTGHLALLLASGHLDGLVQPPDEPAHVVRGTARKAEYIKEQERTVEKDGQVRNKTVIGEKIELIIRAVDHTGVIKTFTQATRPIPAVPQAPVAPDLPATRPQHVEPEPQPAPAAPVNVPVLVGDGGRAFDVG